MGKSAALGEIARRGFNIIFILAGDLGIERPTPS